jgi:TatA/E family protein of Tat protein translocase
VLSLSPLKLLLVAAVIMLLMGPDKLPEMAHRIGSSWRALKRLQERMESEVREAIPDLPSTGDIARIARSPISLLNQLADRVDAKEAASVPETPIPPEPDGSTLFTPPRRPDTPPVRADAPVPPPDPSLN